jgi:hypothetical protein
MEGRSVNSMWKDNWDEAFYHYRQWWQRQGFVLAIWSSVPSRRPHAQASDPGPTHSLEQRYTDPVWRARAMRRSLSRQYFGADSLPLASTDIGPGSLATMIGSEPGLAEDTVWFNPCIAEPESAPPTTFSPENRWWRVHEAIIREQVAQARQDYLVGCPDLVENIDILASLRGSQELLYDLIERPGWVLERLAQINQAFFAAYQRIYDLIKLPDGSSAFGAFALWGPGKTVKVQCDACAMFSPAMFAQFVVPSLTEQCEWLDRSMYHLDGSQCIVQLDHLLAIDALDAIEFTPEAGRQPHGSDPTWWPLYRRILQADKAVQVVGVKQAEVLPLLDALGPRGLYLAVSDLQTPDEVDALYRAVERYR